MKAIWDNQVIAESDNTVVEEGNQYFLPDAIKKEYFKSSNNRTACGWKDTASYYHVEVEGKINENAAWFYPEPKQSAAHIKNYIAFWHGVKVEK